MTLLTPTLICLAGSLLSDTALTKAGTVDRADYAPCGIVSLYLVCQLRNVPVEWERLKELVGPASPEQTHSFADLSRAGRSLGLLPVGLKASREALSDLPMPAILPFRDPTEPDSPPHLLVLLGREADNFYILDAPHSPVPLNESQLDTFWTGDVLVFARDEAEADALVRPIRWEAAVRLAIMALGAALFGCSVWLLAKTFRKAAAVPVLSRFRTLLGKIWHRPTRPIFVLAAFLITLAAVFFALGLTTGLFAPPQPGLAFDTTEIDLGQLPLGRRNVDLFARNEGRAPLRIAEVESNCSCAVASVPGSIAPSERQPIELYLTVTPGPRTVRLVVDSNDPRGKKVLTLSWQGQDVIRLAPTVIVAPPTPLDRALERTIEVIYQGDSKLIPELERAECDSERVVIRQGEPVGRRDWNLGSAEWRRRELHVKVAPPLIPESFEARCKLHFKQGNIKATRHLRIVVPFIGSSIAPRASRVVFSARRPAELVGQERLLHVNVADATEAFAVQELPPWLMAEVESTRDRLRVCRLKVVKEPPGRMLRHTIRITPLRNPRASIPVQVWTFSSQSPLS